MLSNRFPDEVFAEWQDWYICLICGKNTGSALHHILSPSNKYYVKGNHNRSVYNSALLCNETCHLYNPELHREYMTRRLLSATKEIMAIQGYLPREIDYNFFEIYKQLYE